MIDADILINKNFILISDSYIKASSSYGASCFQEKLSVGLAACKSVFEGVNFNFSLDEESEGSDEELNSLEEDNF